MDFGDLAVAAFGANGLAVEGAQEKVAIIGCIVGKEISGNNVSF
jgi:hypothetical protein